MRDVHPVLAATSVNLVSFLLCLSERRESNRIDIVAACLSDLFGIA